MAKIDKKKVGRIATGLTKLLKDEIKRQDLIDTGRMLRETATKIKASANDCSFSISIRSTPYYKFVDGNFKVTDNAFKGAKYNKLIKQMEDLMGDCLESKLV